MNQKLAKRLDHNINRIKDETVRQLLVDLKAELSEQKPAADVDELRKQFNEALAGQIAVFDGDEYPRFRQGPPQHELEALFTAEHANKIMEELKDLYLKVGDKDYNEANPEAVELTDAQTEAVKAMEEMAVMMERAGFVGIMETYKSAKNRLPECVTAQREGGKTTAFDVKLPDGTTITLRNPECVNQEQVVPTAANAVATPKRYQDE